MGITEKKFPCSQSAQSRHDFSFLEIVLNSLKKKKVNYKCQEADAADRQHPESLPFSVSYPFFGDFSKCLRSLKTRTLGLLNPRHSFLSPSPVMQHQDSLPSIDEVTSSDRSDPSRLPSYRETRRYRFHPYSRPIPVLVNEEDWLLVGFPRFFPPLSSLTVPLFRTQSTMMNASYWMFLHYPLVALLLLGSSTFIVT